jgi:hypothetical protein
MTSNKLIIPLLIIAAAFASCGKPERIYTPKEINHIADSIYKSKLKNLQRQAKEDYEKRLPIELKPRVDSILKNRMAEQPVPVFPDDNTGVDDTDSGPTLEQANTKAPISKAQPPKTNDSFAKAKVIKGK